MSNPPEEKSAKEAPDMSGPQSSYRPSPETEQRHMSGSQPSTPSSGREEPRPAPIPEGPGGPPPERHESFLDLPDPRKKYLSTIPGLMRLLEFFLVSVIMALYSYFCTFYDMDLKDFVLPVFLAMSREMCFFLSAFVSFVGNLHVILTVSCSPSAIRAIHASIYFFLFDFCSFGMLVISSLVTAALYSEKTMPPSNSGVAVKQGCCILGTVAGLIHLVGAVCDLIIFLRSRHASNMGRSRSSMRTV